MAHLFPSLQRSCFRFHVLFLLVLSFLSVLPANAGGMELKTTTDLNSAAVCLRLKEGPSITDKEMEDDKKRTALGIGEVVDLELIDNSDEKKVTWEYADPGQENFAVLEEPRDGRKTIRLTVLKNLTQDASVGIKVKNQFGDTRQVTFELKIPKEFKGSQIPGSNPSLANGGGTVPEVTDKDGNPVALQPGQTGTIGAAGSLSVRISPLDVSFANVSVIERANDPQGSRPVHRPNPNSTKLNDTNEFRDNVSAFSTGTGLPQGWTWSCSWKVLDDSMQDTLLITGQDVLQTVTFEQTTQGNASGVKTTINKFGCTVSRDSLTGNYQFKSQP